jgi:hypothetical protein
MDISKLVTVTSFFTAVVDRVLGSDPPPPVENKALNLAQKRANIRAAGVRHGFKAMLARGDEMTQRIEAYKKQRNRNGESLTSIDPVEPEESIILSSTDMSASRRDKLASV